MWFLKRNTNKQGQMYMVWEMAQQSLTANGILFPSLSLCQEKAGRWGFQGAHLNDYT